VDFFLVLKTVTSSGFEPMNLGSSGKHANQYTTEAMHCVRYWDICFPIMP
jgi:hypothetical protein